MTIRKQAISLLRFEAFPIPLAGDLDADPFTRNSRRDSNDRGITRLFIDSIGAIHAGTTEARSGCVAAAGRALAPRRLLP
jgi:hypothetical protein